MRISSLFAALAVVVVASIAGCKAGDTPTYANCAVSADCLNVNDTCVVVMSGSSTSFCTHHCSVGTDCPNSRDGTSFGVCLPVVSGDTVCYSHCNIDADCPLGWMCNPGTVRGAACTPR